MKLLSETNPAEIRERLAAIKPKGGMKKIVATILALPLYLLLVPLIIVGAIIFTIDWVIENMWNPWEDE